MASDNEDDDLDALREAALATLKQKVQPIENVFSGSNFAHSHDTAAWSDVPASIDFPGFSDPIPPSLPQPPQHLFRPATNLPWNPSQQNRMSPFQTQRMRHPNPYRTFGAMGGGSMHDRVNRRLIQRGYLPPQQLRSGPPSNSHLHPPNMALPPQVPVGATSQMGANLIVIQPYSHSGGNVVSSPSNRTAIDSSSSLVNSSGSCRSESESGHPGPKLVLPQDKYHSSGNTCTPDKETESKSKSKDKFSRYDESDSEEDDDDDVSEVDDIANEIDKVLQDDFLAEEITAEEPDKADTKDVDKATTVEAGEEEKRDDIVENAPDSPNSPEKHDNNDGEDPKMPAADMSDISDSESLDLDALAGGEPVIGDPEDLDSLVDKDPDSSIDSLVDKEPENCMDVGDTRPVIDRESSVHSNDSHRNKLFQDTVGDNRKKDNDVYGSSWDNAAFSNRKSPLHRQSPVLPNTQHNSTSPVPYKNSTSPLRKYDSYNDKAYPSPRRSRSPLLSKQLFNRRSTSPRPILRPRSRSPYSHRSSIRRSPISPRRPLGSPNSRRHESSPRPYPLERGRRRSLSPMGRARSPSSRDSYRSSREEVNRARDGQGLRFGEQRYRDFDRSNRDRRRLQPLEREDRSRPLEREDRSRPLEREDRPRPLEREDRPRPLEREDRSRPLEREDRPRQTEREDRPRPTQREDRPRPLEREDRPRPLEREDRPRQTEREERPRPLEREERPRLTEREDRPRLTEREDRPRPMQREDRSRPLEREDRPRPTQREDRTRPTQREDRPRLTEREDRPRPTQREDRPQQIEKQDKPRPIMREDIITPADREDRIRPAERGDRPQLTERDRLGNKREMNRSDKRGPKDNVRDVDNKTSPGRIRLSPLLEKNSTSQEKEKVNIDVEKLTPEERAKIEARRKKFDSKIEVDVTDTSKKISLKDIKKRDKKAKKKEEKLEEVESLKFEEALPDVENKKSSKSGISLRKLRKKQETKKKKDEEQEVDDESPKAVGVADLEEESEEDSDEGRSWRKEISSTSDPPIRFGVTRTMVQKAPLVSLDSIGRAGRRSPASNRKRFQEHHERRSRLERSRVDRSQKIQNKRWSSDEDSENGGIQASRLTSSVVASKPFKADIPPEKLRIQIQVASKDGNSKKKSKAAPDFTNVYSVRAKRHCGAFSHNYEDEKEKVKEEEEEVVPAKKIRKEKKKKKKHSKNVSPKTSPEELLDDNDVLDSTSRSLAKPSVLERLGKKVSLDSLEKKEKKRKKSKKNRDREVDEDTDDLDLHILKMKAKNEEILRRQREIDLDKERYG